MYRLRKTLFVFFILTSATSSFAGSGKNFYDKVNLALRQTGDALLLSQNDSTTAIPPISQVGDNEYVLQINSEFDYGLLPVFLKEAFYDYKITNSFEVMVKSCDDGRLMLGFNSAAMEKDTVACQNRGENLQCATIHFKMLDSPTEGSPGRSLAGFAWLLVPVAGLSGLILLRKKEKSFHSVVNDDGGIPMGDFRFYPQEQKLKIEQETILLTYRESKLLDFLVHHMGQVLARDEILAAVWEEEGIIVSRSLDVFISRLRKILNKNHSVVIKTVHGVGYRLEVNEQ